MDPRSVASFAGVAGWPLEADGVRRHRLIGCSLRGVAAARPVTALALDATSRRKSATGGMASQTDLTLPGVVVHTLRRGYRPCRLGPEDREGLCMAGQSPLARHVTHGLSAVAGGADHDTDDVRIVVRRLRSTRALPQFAPESRVGDPFQRLVVIEGLHIQHRRVRALLLVADHAGAAVGLSQPRHLCRLGIEHDLGRHVLASRPVAKLALNPVLYVEGGVELPRLDIRGGGVAAEADRVGERALVDPGYSGNLRRLGQGEGGVSPCVWRPVPAVELVALKAAVTFAADLCADKDLFGGARTGRGRSEDRQEERLPDHFFFTSGSVTVMTWLTLTLSRVEVRPLGQRTSIRSTFSLFPTPKWARKSPWLR